jgi:hypothetical protein
MMNEVESEFMREFDYAKEKRDTWMALVAIAAFLDQRGKQVDAIMRLLTDKAHRNIDDAASKSFLRMALIKHVSDLAVSPAYDVAREVMPEFSPYIRAKLSTLALHAYCENLINNRIWPEYGKYEPHALYFRTFMIDRLRMILPAVQELVERPT